MPFSWALSAEDTGLTGIATKDDMNCVNWLLNESSKSVKIVGDSNAVYLISGYSELIPDTWAKYGREDRLVTMLGLPKLKDGYIFLTDWNMRHKKTIECSDVGLRRQYEFTLRNDIYTYQTNGIEDTRIEILSVLVKEVYKSGNAVILQIRP
jgi:uncharacterized membrane protein